jgi:predicted dehydrogenase
VWTNRPLGYWPQGLPRPNANAAQTNNGQPLAWNGPGVEKRLAAAMAAGGYPVPSTLRWDLFLGVAPEVEYHPVYHPFNWRGWVEWGQGALGDMGAHLIDFPVWALEPGLPTRVETRHSRWPGNADLWSSKRPAELSGYPLASVTHYEFGKAKGGPIAMTWYDGGILPPTPEGFPADLTMSPDGGVLFVGSKGMLMHETYGEKPTLIGEGLTEKAARIPKSLPRIAGGMGGHEMNWIRAIRGEEKISSPFEYAVPLNETMILGVVALRADQAIEYDGVAGRVTNVADANQYLGRTYRKGWEL